MLTFLSTIISQLPCDTQHEWFYRITAFNFCVSDPAVPTYMFRDKYHMVVLLCLHIFMEKELWYGLPERCQKRHHLYEYVQKLHSQISCLWFLTQENIFQKRLQLLKEDISSITPVCALFGMHGHSTWLAPC